MSFQIQDDGKYHVPIVDLGKRLRDNFGLTVKEHSAFGGVSPVHAPNSFHDYNEAIDVTDWRSDTINGVGWKQRTANLRNLLKGSGKEVLGPGDKGHDTHLHLGNYGGIFKLSPQQYNYLFGGKSGGNQATFGDFDPSAPSPSADLSVTPASTSRSSSESTPTNYADMSDSQMKTEYDRLRMAGDVFKAQEAGLAMHRAKFNK